MTGDIKWQRSAKSAIFYDLEGEENEGMKGSLRIDEVALTPILS